MDYSQSPGMEAPPPLPPSHVEETVEYHQHANQGDNLVDNPNLANPSTIPPVNPDGANLTPDLNPEVNPNPTESSRDVKPVNSDPEILSEYPVNPSISKLIKPDNPSTQQDIQGDSIAVDPVNPNYPQINPPDENGNVLIQSRLPNLPYLSKDHLGDYLDLGLISSDGHLVLVNKLCFAALSSYAKLLLPDLNQSDQGKTNSFYKVYFRASCYKFTHLQG